MTKPTQNRKKKTRKIGGDNHDETGESRSHFFFGVFGAFGFVTT